MGRKFHLIVVKSHLHTPWIVFKFPICNTLLWRMTELRGINVTAPSGYLCDPGMKSKELAEAETHTQIWGEKNLAWEVKAHLVPCELVRLFHQRAQRDASEMD